MDNTNDTLPHNREDAFWASLEEALPPVFARHDLPKFIGGLLTPAGLANLDSKGLGPSVRVQFGKYIGYEKINFIEWLNSRCGTACAPVKRAIKTKGDRE